MPAESNGLSKRISEGFFYHRNFVFLGLTKVIFFSINKTELTKHGTKK